MYDEYNEDGYGDFNDSDLRKHLNNDILFKYPRKIRDKMTVFDNGDMVSIPTEKEIFGVNEYGEAEDVNVEQFDIMKQRKNRIAFHGYGSDEWECYWLANKKRNSVYHFAHVNGHGNLGYDGASGVRGVRPIFLLKNQ